MLESSDFILALTLGTSVPDENGYIAPQCSYSALLQKPGPQMLEQIHQIVL